MTAAESSRPTRLAIVGASARAAAFSALDAGFEVVTADLFADADLAARLAPGAATRIDNYPDGLVDWLARQDVDAWMYTGALENHPELIDRMAEIRPLWGNRGEALRRCRDPMGLQRLCNEAGVLFPETRTSPEGLPLDGSWLCKTYRGACGSGVWSLDSQAAGRRAADAGAVYQQRIDGAPVSLLFCFAGDRCGGQLIAITRQLVSEAALGAAAFAYCGSTPAVGICAEADEDDLFDQFTAIGFALQRGLSLRGVCGVDAVVRDGRAVVIEVNPRFPASAELAPQLGVDSTAEPLLSRHAAAFQPERPLMQPAGCSSSPAGKAVLFAKFDLAIDVNFHAWAMAEADAGRLADIPDAGTPIAQGQPVCTLLEPPPVEGVLDRLKGRAADLYRRLAECRASG